MKSLSSSSTPSSTFPLAEPPPPPLQRTPSDAIELVSYVRIIDAQDDQVDVTTTTTTTTTKKHHHKHSLKHHIPRYLLMGNPHLKRGHRVRLNAWAAFLSLFHLHNETCNIWIHLIGTIAFTIFTYWIYSTSQLQYMPFHDRIICYIYLIAVILCLATSSIAHTFACHSAKIYRAMRTLARFHSHSHFHSRSHSYEHSHSHSHSHIPIFPYSHSHFHILDYLSILALLLASDLPMIVFGFRHDPLMRDIYITLAVGVVVGGMIYICHLPDLEYNQNLLRAMLFIVAFGYIHLLHELYLKRYAPDDVHRILWSWARSFAFYAIGILFFALQFPECVCPKTFDLFGSSHQWWHICVMVGALFHFASILEYQAYARESWWFTIYSKLKYETTFE